MYETCMCIHCVCVCILCACIWIYYVYMDILCIYVYTLRMYICIVYGKRIILVLCVCLYRVVLGMSADKDVEKVVRILTDRVPARHIYPVSVRTLHIIYSLSIYVPGLLYSTYANNPAYTTPIAQARTPRAMSAQDLRVLIYTMSTDQSGHLQQSVPPEISSLEVDSRQGIEDAISHALEDYSANIHLPVNPISSEPDIILICGTAFIMSEARAALGIVEPRDAEVMSEGEKRDNLDSQVSVLHFYLIFLCRAFKLITV